RWPYLLVSKIGRTQFESKSQLTQYGGTWNYSWYQRSEEPSLKANHNHSMLMHLLCKVGIKDRKNPV
ncbi:hypothetical protein, partial [Brevundimonas sp.]|uniref:hypothetical protein n=1 Tax=Brevundimonas sp. TaxID=1871086 RepID=UPI00272F8E97